MPIEPVEIPQPEPANPEYILVGDRDSQVIFSSAAQTPVPENPLAETIKLAKLIRKAGGEVTVFKATQY